MCLSRIGTSGIVLGCMFYFYQSAHRLNQRSEHIQMSIHMIAVRENTVNKPMGSYKGNQSQMSQLWQNNLISLNINCIA